MISIENLVKDYGSTRALKGINVEIPRGQVIGLLGPNGAGKSTTLRILTGYIKPTSGKIEVKGLDVTKHATEVKKMIGYLPESAPLYSEMLVWDYLNYIADLRGIKKPVKAERVRELAGLCGIKEVMHRPVRTLSKGYKQRVGLAQALMDDPEILVLDEPTSGLDPNQIVEIRSIIREIGKEKTVIFSTHILSEAEAACSRVVIINRGEVAADGSTEMLRSGGRNDRNIALFLSNTDENSTREKFSVNPQLSLSECTVEENGLRVVLGCSGDLRAEIYGIIKETDWVLLEMTEQKKTLENIFREITGEEKK